MKQKLFKTFILGLFLFWGTETLKAQSMMVLNPDDKECVIRCYKQSVMGNMATVKITVDNQKKYYYEYNWKNKTGYLGEKVSWERDVMQIAYNACKNGVPLEKVGFKPMN